MADTKQLTYHTPVILDENSSIPASMSEFLGEAGRKYVKNQSLSNYKLSKNGFMSSGDDEPEPGTITRQHWYFERPLLNMLTGQNFRIDYPEAFDDIVWEYAQGERDAAEKDVLAYVTWYKSKREYKSEVAVALPNPIPSVVWADNTPPPSMTISAEAVGNFKKRLLQTLKGHEFEKLLSKHVNDIMNRTRASARKAGKAKAKTNPLVEEVLRTLSIDEIVPD